MELFLLGSGPTVMPIGFLFVHAGTTKQGFFGQGWGLELEADGEACGGKTTGQTYPGDTSEIGTNGVQVD